MGGPLVRRLGTSISQFFNVLIFNGHPDETISGRAYRQGVLEGDRRWALFARFIDLLFWFDPEHCKGSHEMDIAFAKYILSLHEHHQERQEGTDQATS